MREQVRMLWETMESWDSAVGNESAEPRFREGATESAIEKLKCGVGMALPEDFLDSLRRHDGSPAWLVDMHEGILLGVDEILYTLDDMRKLAEENGIDWPIHTGIAKPSVIGVGSGWSSGWIPIHKTDWSTTCFDFDPPAGTRVGQIVEIDWYCGSVKVVAADFLEFLSLYVKRVTEAWE